jgi:hypothetical protein
MEAFVAGIGILGPGMANWPQARAALRSGTLPDLTQAVTLPPPSLLAPNERRRAAAATRLALAVASEAVAHSGVPATSLAGIFGSACGDGATVNAILESQAAADGFISPTQFHNSVHNAASGYWAIGTGARGAISCIGCHSETAAAGLLQAMAHIAAEMTPALLCLYDVPMPPPLSAVYPCAFPLGIALVLTPEPGSTALVRMRYGPGRELAGQVDSPFDAIAAGNPVGHILPVLEAIARGQAACVAMRLLDMTLGFTISPCSTAAAF